MAMMTRGLGPVRSVSVRGCQLSDACGARALLLPELRASGSTSSPVSASSAPHNRNTAAGATRPYSAAAGGVTVAATRENMWETSAFSLRRTSGSIRRSSGSGGGSDCYYRAAPGCRLNPSRATALLPCSGGRRDESRGGGACSARALRGWRSGGEGVALLQLAGLRTSASVSGPAGDSKRPGGQQEGAAAAAAASSNSHIRSPASAAAEVAAEKTPATGAQSAEEGKTVKGGNPACQTGDGDGDGDGNFVHMRDRIRQGRLDASEDAKDWMRDKRDDMNTMKEVSRAGVKSSTA